MISHNHTLTIESNDADVCGDWNAADVEAEMIDLEIPIENDCSWLKYILCHVLEDCDVNIDALVAVLNAGDSLSTVELQFNGVRICIELVRS